MSDGNSPPDAPTNGRARRSSITSNTFTALFGRSNSVSSPPSGTAAQPAAVATSPSTGRRMSISTLGLSGTSPIQGSPFGFPGGRRGSVSTAGSDSIDENAIDDDDGPSSRSQPTTPYARRMSFGAQALLSARTNGATSGTAGRAPSYTTTSPLSPIEDQEAGDKRSSSTQASTQSKPRTTSDYSSTRSAEGLNWSEQFRSRAESAVQRPSFSTSPTNTIPRSPMSPSHERSKSISDMPAPPTSSLSAPSREQQSALRRKPDAVGERILRGDFYMD